MKNMFNIALLTPPLNVIWNFDSEYSLCYFFITITSGWDLEFTLLVLIVKDMCHH